jgi:two-component system, NarL family, response regulator DesR
MLGDKPAGLDLPAILAGSLDVEIPVIFLSQFGGRVFVERALSGGAAGYLLKTVDAHELGAAITTVAAGGTVFPKAALRPPAGPRRPTPRETEILSLIADGASTAEAASRLGISVNTVETHVARLLARYGASSRTQLAVMADRHGWLSDHHLPRD